MPSPRRPSTADLAAQSAVLVICLLAVFGGCVLGLIELGLGFTLGLIAVSAVGWAVLVARDRRLRRADDRANGGMCADCGYDLRQSADRCPECGADIPPSLARRRRLRAIGARTAADRPVEVTPPPQVPPLQQPPALPPSSCPPSPGPPAR